MDPTSSAPGPTSQLARLLRAQRERVVARFVVELERMYLPPAGLSRALLVDHIPQFLDEVIDELGQLGGVHMDQEADDTSEIARQHGEQRWSLGYDLEALIREYGVLRHVIIEAAREEAVQLSLDEFDILAKCLSIGVAEAATAYAKDRDAQLNAQRANLKFLAEAGQVLSSSLDSRATLSRLTMLLVPRFADWCAIHIEPHRFEDMVVAHVDPTKLELVRDVSRQLLSAEDSPYRIATELRAQSAQLLSEVAPAPPTGGLTPPESATVDPAAARSRLVVPLRVQQHVLGALVLAYGDSRRTYNDDDAVLATEFANRAAIALDNARLYELTQHERSRVEAASRTKDELLATVSHELRTPLHAILGWTRLLRRGTVDAVKTSHALEVIERNAEAQNQVVGDLLDISRASDGKLRIDLSRLNVSDVLEVAVESVRPAAEAKEIRLEYSDGQEDAIVQGDPDRLQQVFWNLIGNAVKFTPKQGVIRVELRRVQSDVEVIVQDTGIGMDADFIPHVFEAFRQADASSTRRHGGLGLGLSVAKHIVALHGGSIEASSPGRDQGSTFRVSLPVGAAASTRLGVTGIPATSPQSADAEASAGQGVRVLVVDDEEDARDLLTYVLEGRGFDVSVAGSATEALAELVHFKPHVVLSDIGMPEQDGYALIREIRTHAAEEHRDIPAIALTAFASNEDRTRALVAGFNLHIAKPVEPTALVRAVLELAGIAPSKSALPNP